MNNDRFRFRVWDKDNECYQEEDAEWCFLSHDGKVDCGVSSDYDTVKEWRLKHENAVVEQCTGYCDKNGKLVYEGDILRGKRFWYSLRKEEFVFYKVIWYQMKFQLQNLNDLGDTAMVFSPADYEIIGNIHENNERKENAD